MDYIFTNKTEGRVHIDINFWLRQKPMAMQCLSVHIYVGAAETCLENIMNIVNILINLKIENVLTFSIQTI